MRPKADLYNQILEENHPQLQLPSCLVVQSIRIVRQFVFYSMIEYLDKPLQHPETLPLPLRMYVHINQFRRTVQEKNGHRILPR